jgi:type IV pilus assembly protein PilA
LGKQSRGFTLVELMVVIAIVGVLAMIAIPKFLGYRRLSNDSAAHSDIKNLYTSAQVYYTDYPAGSGTLDDFKDYGFRQTSRVDVTVNSGTQSSFSADTHHTSGNKTYHISADGTISKSS